MGRTNLVGCTAILAGLAIILALILPAQVWWFLFAAALICVGVRLLRRC